MDPCRRSSPCLRIAPGRRPRPPHGGRLGARPLGRLARAHQPADLAAPHGHHRDVPLHGREVPPAAPRRRAARHRREWHDAASSGRSSTATRATARRSTSCAFPRTLRLLLWKKLGPLLGLRRRPEIRPRTRARAMGKTLHRQGKSSAGRPFCLRSATGTSDRCSVPGGRQDGPSPTCSGASTTRRTASSGRTPTASGISRDGCATGSRRGRVTAPPARSGQRGMHRFERSRRSAGPSGGPRSIRSRGRTRFAGRCGPGSAPKCPWPSSGTGIRAG